jgi:hypothetical protein
MENKPNFDKADYICDLIYELLNTFDSDSGDKQAITEMIIVHSAIYGSTSTIEGIGILTNSITSFTSICEDAWSSESNS